MANVSDVPAIHRDLAGAIPDEILPKLSATELRLRCEAMAEYQRKASAPGLEPEVARYLTGRARRVAKSMPAAEFVQRQKELHNQAAGCGHEAAQAYMAVARRMREQNCWPDELISAVELALLGKESTPDAEAIVRHSRG